MTTDDSSLYSAEHLREFTRRVFEHYGVSPRDADVAADVLGASDLRGIDSHGISRLPAYSRFLSQGVINPRPSITVVRETPSTACVDGDNGLGLIVGPAANLIAMDKADAVGSGWVSVRNSTHFGIAGYYPLQSLHRNQIGWAMTNGTSWIAPIWGAERMLGTNPIAIAFPGKHEPPIVIDMATSAVAYGKIQLARRHNEPIPEGWAADRDGHSTTDPDAVDQDGTLLPLGSDRQRGGHKGFCLAAMVDLLSGALSGANWGPFVPPFVLTDFNKPKASVGQGIGHFFGAMQIEGFIDPDEFRRQVDQWIRTVHEMRPTPHCPSPLVPGEPEFQAHQQRSLKGIPLVSSVVQSLRRLAADTRIPFD